MIIDQAEMTGNIVRVSLILILCVVAPWLLNNRSKARKVPRHIIVFCYGYSTCALIDWQWASEGGIVWFSHYPPFLESVPCGATLLFIFAVQLFAYYAITREALVSGMSSSNHGVQISSFFLSFLVALIALACLITPELLWR